MSDQVTDIVFVGPSCPTAVATAIHSAAMYLPPVAQGDIIHALQRYKPRRILVIDGVFGQRLAVWHKELMWAMKEGVELFGASSMGALRAAELAKFGMTGFGEIYEGYRNGIIEDDDEVALIFGPEEMSWMAMSLPMVNIRASVKYMRDCSYVDPFEGDLLLQKAKHIFFADRTFESIKAILIADLGHQRAENLVRVLGLNYIDQKCKDAKDALRHLATTAPLDKPARLEFFETTSLRILAEQDAPVSCDHGSIRRRNLAKYAAVTHSGFQELCLSAAMEAAALEFAKQLGLAVTTTQTDDESRRIRLNLGLTSDLEFVRWLDANDMSDRDFQNLANRRATCRLVQAFVNSKRARQENTTLVLDALRLRGEYPDIKRDAISAYNSARLKRRTPSNDGWILRSHMLNSGWDIDTDIETWLKEGCFKDFSELVRTVEVATQGAHLTASDEISNIVKLFAQGGIYGN